MRAMVVLRRLRVVLYVALALFTVYLVLRFDVVALAEEGSSPLLAFEPGAKLLVDRWPGVCREGDVVLYEGVEETVQLGRITRPPRSAPAEVWEAVEAGNLWIESDRPGHPVRDSRVLGALSPDRVEARVCFGLPW